MNAMTQRIGLMAGGVLAAVSVWACSATRQADGSVTITISPDMAINAWGLEDALSKLTDLLGACRGGTYERPCTDAERDDISKAIAKIVDRKDNLRAPNMESRGAPEG